MPTREVVMKAIEDNAISGRHSRYKLVYYDTNGGLQMHSFRTWKELEKIIYNIIHLGLRGEHGIDLDTVGVYESTGFERSYL